MLPCLKVISECKNTLLINYSFHSHLGTGSKTASDLARFKNETIRSALAAASCMPPSCIAQHRVPTLERTWMKAKLKSAKATRPGGVWTPGPCLPYSWPLET